MLAKKKKLSKKQIKEDKLVTSYYQATRFIEENQSKLISAAVVIAVVIVGVILYTNKLEADNQEATAAMAKVMPLFQAGNYQQAIDGTPGTDVIGFKQIAEDYSGTEQGELAKIYLANSYYFLGQFDSAYEYYEDYSGDIPLFKATAIAGQAGVLVQKEDFERAAELYNEAAQISENNPANADYLLKAGINYIKVGKLAEAKRVLNKVKNEYTNSQAFRKVDRYLAQIQID